MWKGRDAGIAKSSLTTSFLTSLAVQGVNAFTGILLAQSLGVASRGALAAVILWPSIVTTLGLLGISDAATYFISRGRPLKLLIGTIGAILAAQSAVLLAISVVVTRLVLDHYGGAVVHASYVYALTIPVYLAVAYSLALLQGSNRLRAFQVLRFGVVATTAGVLALLALAGDLEVGTAVWAYVAAYFIVALVGCLLILADARGMGFDAALCRELLGYGVRSHTDSVSSIFNQKLDQLLISIFLAPARLGLYVAAVTLTSLANLVGFSISLVAMPAIARLEAGVVRTETAVRYIRLTLAAASCVALPMVALAPLVVRVVFGHEFAAAAGPARILLVATVVYNLARVTSTTLKATGRPLQAGIGEAIALAVTCAGLAALLPLLGITGAALASLLAYALSAAWMVRTAARVLDGDVRQFVLGSFAAHHRVAPAPPVGADG